MNLIGFAFTKLHAEKKQALVSKVIKSNNLEIINVEKEELSVQMKNPAYRVSFMYDVKYSNKDSKKDEVLGQVTMEGYVVLALEEAEGKEFLKNWKKKDLPDALKQPLLNLILRKCAPKALDMEDTISLPFHIPIPQINIKK